MVLYNPYAPLDSPLYVAGVATHSDRKWDGFFQVKVLMVITEMADWCFGHQINVFFHSS